MQRGEGRYQGFAAVANLCYTVRMDKKLIDHCRQHRIKWTYETDVHIEFIAPKGKTFGNDSKYRILDTEMESTQSCLLLLSL